MGALPVFGRIQALIVSKDLVKGVIVKGFFWKSCGCIWTILERRQHTGQDFQAQVFFVSQSVCTSLDDSDLVVQSFNETKRNFVLGFAVGGDPTPMSIDHLTEVTRPWRTAKVKA
jgi:hypothetical protein